MEYNGEMYYYVYNIVGDVKGMYDSDGNVVAKYSYSGYGEPAAIKDSNNQSVKDDPTHIANINPFRFKGYYFDAETEFYYLNTRYYDPYVCRFLNADAYISTGQGVLSYNMFAYCQNDPINMSDSDGKMPVRNRMLLMTDAGSYSNGKPCPVNPRLASAPSLLGKSADELSRIERYTYNCYGNGIGKQILDDPTGYVPGESTLTTYCRVVKDLGGSHNVRKLKSIDDPIRKDEFRVAMKCGQIDYHFIRQLEDGTWYNKSGRTIGTYATVEDVMANTWTSIYMKNDERRYGDIGLYTYETIYFAVRIGWDS